MSRDRPEKMSRKRQKKEARGWASEKEKSGEDQARGG